MSLKEAASKYGFSDAHLRDLMIHGVLRGRKFGNAWAVEDASLRAYVRRDRKPGPRPLAKRPRKRG